MDDRMPGQLDMFPTPESMISCCLDAGSLISLSPSHLLVVPDHFLPQLNLLMVPSGAVVYDVAQLFFAEHAPRRLKPYPFGLFWNLYRLIYIPHALQINALDLVNGTVAQLSQSAVQPDVVETVDQFLRNLGLKFPCRPAMLASTQAENTFAVSQYMARYPLIGNLSARSELYRETHASIVHLREAKLLNAYLDPSCLDGTAPFAPVLVLSVDSEIGMATIKRWFVAETEVVRLSELEWVKSFPTPEEWQQRQIEDCDYLVLNCDPEGAYQGSMATEPPITSCFLNLLAAFDEGFRDLVRPLQTPMPGRGHKRRIQAPPPHGSEEEHTDHSYHLSQLGHHGLPIGTIRHQVHEKLRNCVGDTAYICRLHTTWNEAFAASLRSHLLGMSYNRLSQFQTHFNRLPTHLKMLLIHPQCTMADHMPVIRPCFRQLYLRLYQSGYARQSTDPDHRELAALTLLQLNFGISATVL